VKGLFKKLGVEALVLELDSFGMHSTHFLPFNQPSTTSLTCSLGLTCSHALLLSRSLARRQSSCRCLPAFCVPADSLLPVEEQDIQDALFDLTGQKTVPNVFIGTPVVFLWYCLKVA